MMRKFTQSLVPLLFTTISSFNPNTNSKVFSSKLSRLHTTSLRAEFHVKTRFVLIETKHNGNVGAAARALKTMGFGDLALIRPNDERVLGRKKCIDGASGAKDVLSNAQIYNSVEEMVHGEKNLIVCGTGMPIDMSLTRSGLKSTVAPRQYFEKIVEEYKVKVSNGSNYECDENKEGINIAFLFGNERYGMNAEDMKKCEVILGIPTNPDFGSLNVASAVQLIAYDWREAIGGFKYEIEAHDES